MEAQQIKLEDATASVSAACPVTFSDTVGLFAPAQGTASAVGVLFVSPWGLEEMCLRKFWRVLAEGLALQGIASLRFDYPGTGDALDVSDQSAGLGLWEKSVVAAAAALREMSGCRHLIVVAQGLGAALAAKIAGSLGDVAGMALLAPVTSGRAFLREMQIWSRMVDEGLGVPEAFRQREGVSIAGLSMPDAIAADVRKLAVGQLSSMPFSRAFVCKRADRPADAELAGHFETLGIDVQVADYAGYDDFISNPATSVLPEGVLLRLLEWVTGVAAAFPTLPSTPSPRSAEAPALLGDGFRETPARFGEHGRLYGVLCEPQGPRTGATVVIVGTAYDRHAGWGRSGVHMARELARTGIASLRFDGANIGDSPAVAGQPMQVLYQDCQVADVQAALDFLARRDLGPMVVAGRCSGAYLAFRSAVADPRLSAAVVVNPFVFYWDPAVDIDGALRYVPRSLDDYRDRLFQFETFRRLFSGRVDARRALGNIGRAVVRRLSQFARPLIRMLQGQRGVHAEVSRSFHTLAERKTELVVLYSENDVGFEHFVDHFGRAGRGLRRYPNAHMSVVPGADHNFTPAPARRVYTDTIIDLARRFPPGT